MIGLVSTSGTLYTFVHTGHLAGTTELWLRGGSRDDDWDVSGTNPALAAGWKDLEGPHWYHPAKANLDVDALIQDIETAAQIAGKIVSIVS